MKFVIFDQNVFWDLEYKNLPVFIKSNSFSKKDWIINNFFQGQNNFDLALANGIENYDFDEEFLSFNLELEATSESELEAKIQSKINWFKQKNYIGLYKDNNFVKFYFIQDILYENTFVQFELVEDVVFNVFEKFYQNLNQDIWVNRAHINRYKLDGITNQITSFNWSENSYLLNKETFLENHLATNKTDYLLKAKIDARSFLAVFVGINNFENTHITPLTLDGIKQKYAVVVLPFYKNDIFQADTTALKKLYQYLSDSQGYTILGIKVINYLPADKVATTEDTIIKTSNSENGSTEIIGYQLKNNTDIKLNLNLEIVDENNIKINFFDAFKPLVNSENNFDLEPKTNQWPVKYLQIEKSDNNKKIYDPAFLNLLGTDFDNLILYNSAISPYYFKEHISLDNSFYNCDFAIGDNLVIQNKSSIPTNRNEFEINKIESKEINIWNDVNKEVYDQAYLFMQFANYKKTSTYANKSTRVREPDFYQQKDLIDSKYLEDLDSKRDYLYDYSDEKFKNHNYFIDNDFLFNLNKAQANTNLFKISLIDTDNNQKAKIANYFNKYGYLINGSLNKETVFNSRKTFNYIQIKSLKNNFANQKNLTLFEIEQLINFLNQGIRIWHQTNSASINWLNYQVSNDEEVNNV